MVDLGADRAPFSISAAAELTGVQHAGVHELLPTWREPQQPGRAQTVR